MIFYLGLIAVLLISSFIVNMSVKGSSEKKNKIILALNIFLLWVICALKKDTVGVDIEGYKRVYEESASWPWFAFYKVYYEEGYTLLMQLFSKPGLPFQVFNAFVYAVIYIPWYFFLKKYSRQPTLSLLIYYCYQFFVFNMSGLRQGIAMSLCLLAYMVLRRNTKRSIIQFLLIVFAAVMIHRSALVFLVVLGIRFIKPGMLTIILFSMACVSVIVFRAPLIGFLNTLSRTYQISEAMTLGGSFFMLSCFTIFSVVIDYFVRRMAKEKRVETSIDFAPTYMMMWAVVLNLAFNGAAFLRAATYTSCFLTIALPESLAYCDKKSRFIISMMFGVFLIALFITDVLVPNQLEIIPYCFFWD